jgi:acetyl-CoA acetyltransferase
VSDVVIRGVGVAPFGRHLDRTMKELGREATDAALADGDVGLPDLDAVVFSNALAGLITGQECIRGETVVHAMGLGSLPVHNVENACASGGNALHLANLMVASGQHDTVLALGVEKANHADRARTFSAYQAGMDVEDAFAVGDGAGTDRTPFVDRQARLASMLIEEWGIGLDLLAQLTARSLTNAVDNPYAHRRFGATAEEVLAARTVVPPLTSLMSSPVSDGAAAVVVTRADDPQERDVRIAASQMATRPPIGTAHPSATRSAADAAYAQAGIGPDDVDVAEVHDASIAYELIAWRETGLCPPGEEPDWIASGRTARDGARPINPSGGLVGRGHALGASGLAQVAELVEQLRGEAGTRQAGSPRLALAQIGGGVIDWETAVASVHVLVR